MHTNAEVSLYTYLPDVDQEEVTNKGILAEKESDRTKENEKEKDKKKEKDDALRMVSEEARASVYNRFTPQLLPSGRNVAN